MKHAIECAGLDKNKVASQLKELQANLDNVSRLKHTAESRVQVTYLVQYRINYLYRK